MPEHSDRFGDLCDSLEWEGILRDWEQGGTTDEDIRNDAKRVLGIFDIRDGRSPSSGRRHERRVLQDIPVEPSGREI